MRPLFYVILLIWFTHAEKAKAQATDRQDPAEDSIDSRFLPDFGIRAGVNYSNVWDDQGQEFVSDASRGFAGGFFLSIPFGSYLGFQPEVLFSQKGYRRDRTLPDESTVIFTRTASYIDIPFLLQFKPAAFLTILGGPHYSILIMDAWEYSDRVDQEPEELGGGDIRNNLIGLGGGLDVHYSRAVLSLRAGWDLLANEGDGQTEDPRYKNRWLQIAVGIRL